MEYHRSLADVEHHIVGHNARIETPIGEYPLIYADWAASGRLYGPIEDKMRHTFGPWVANTHTETNATGCAMTQSYHQAKDIIKAHVNANKNDALIMSGAGMTSAVTLLQRIMGWRLPERWASPALSDEERPLVLISELEHHSNQTSWLETIADVIVLPGTTDQPVDLAVLDKILTDNHGRTTKVAAITAGSNVTGVRPPIHNIAEIMHQHAGLCFVDYTCAAPYDAIDMHPSDEATLDAIYFSPHKFLGGPGAPGALVFNEKLYQNAVPDRPGGGTVHWTNPWGGRRYYDDIETREDGGTPPFLGTIRAALAIRLKEQMGLQAIAAREKEICETVFSDLGHVAGVSILAPQYTDRLAVFALHLKDLHYNLGTRLLNDYFGIQVRGGCACAGTYGHQLFGIDPERSETITNQIDRGDLSAKPGFMRLSLHPTMSDSTVRTITDAVRTIARDGEKMAKDYRYDMRTNEFQHKNGSPPALSQDIAFQL